MNAHSMDPIRAESDQMPQRPRIALMGEFSAGKSTLMNLLLGCDPLPVQITATRVPPVWVSYGPETATRVLSDGTEEPLDAAELAETPLEGTRAIRLTLESDVLQLCDLLDIPGISDPSMSHTDWSGLMHEIDSVIWCTHATQAWRQSEAALWAELSERTDGNNILVVTQFDKLKTDRDRSRVLARLNKEAGDAFQSIFPLATLEAMQAGVDEDAWIRSGGAALVEHLVGMLVRMEAEQGDPDLAAVPDVDAAAHRSSDQHALQRIQTCQEPEPHSSRPEIAPDDAGAAAADADETASRVMPRRVRPKADSSPRPPAAEFQGAEIDLSLLKRGARN